MRTNFLVVDGCVPTAEATFDLRHEAWSIALDQRAFGPRKLLVAFADDEGKFRGLAFTDRIEPIDDAVDACISYLGPGAATAIAFNDEPVDKDTSPDAYFPSSRRCSIFSTAGVSVSSTGSHATTISSAACHRWPQAVRDGGTDMSDLARGPFEQGGESLSVVFQP